MLICANCGKTNPENESNICINCGALLPVTRSKRRRRIEMPTDEKRDDEIVPEQENYSIDNNKIKNDIPDKIPVNPEAAFFAPRGKEGKSIESNLELNEIPLPENISENENKNELIQIPTIETNITPPRNIASDKPSVKELRRENGISLQEIKPLPYQGSIVRPIVPNIQDSAKQEKRNNKFSLPSIKPLETVKSSREKKTVPLNKISIETNVESSAQISDSLPSMQKQKQLDLEQDMVKVLKFISSKLKMSKNVTLAKKEIPKKLEKEIKPSSLNEILKSLLRMDKFIEAAALLKMDGTILAAAISSRISDSLFATIGQNLSMIGNDIVHGLSAGELHSISVRGTHGILDLAPLGKESTIVKDMLLMIFSNPKVKHGIINLALRNVEKQIIEFLNGI